MYTVYPFIVRITNPKDNSASSVVYLAILSISTALNVKCNGIYKRNMTHHKPEYKHEENGLWIYVQKRYWHLSNEPYSNNVPFYSSLIDSSDWMINNNRAHLKITDPSGIFIYY